MELSEVPARHANSLSGIELCSFLRCCDDHMGCIEVLQAGLLHGVAVHRFADTKYGHSTCSVTGSNRLI
jgi:hypothetical protein